MTWVPRLKNGTVMVAKEACKDFDIELRGARVAIQGFGNVGSWAAHFFAKEGAKVIAVSDLKGGIVNLTRTLAVVWAPKGVRVNCLSPGGFPGDGPINQEFAENFRAKVPLGRMGNSTDLKGAVVFLASDAGAYVVGQNLLVDGGWTAW